MDRILAQLTDADISLTLEQKGSQFNVKATRFDSITEPAAALDSTHGNLGDAIKAIMVFFVQEWESVFVQNRLSEKLAQAITAA